MVLGPEKSLKGSAVTSGGRPAFDRIGTVRQPRTTTREVVTEGEESLVTPTDRRRLRDLPSGHFNHPGLRFTYKTRKRPTPEAKRSVLSGTGFHAPKPSPPGVRHLSLLHASLARAPHSRAPHTRCDGSRVSGRGELAGQCHRGTPGHRPFGGGGCRPDRCILCRPGPGDLPAASVSDEWEDQQARGTLSRGAPSLFLQPLPLGEPPAATLRTPPLV